jgi:hypothetical protein
MLATPVTTRLPDDTALPVTVKFPNTPLPPLKFVVTFKLPAFAVPETVKLPNIPV